MLTPPYTDDTSVRGIIGDYIDDDFDLDPFIESSDMLVSARIVPAGYSDQEVPILAKYLTAHLVLANYPMLSQETAGRASESILTRVDIGLKLTHPGQQLLLLDYKGALVGLGTDRKKVGVTWLGQKPQDRKLPGRFYTWDELFLL